jgi:hypothetical protein
MTGTTQLGKDATVASLHIKLLLNEVKKRVLNIAQYFERRLSIASGHQCQLIQVSPLVSPVKHLWSLEKRGVFYIHFVQKTYLPHHRHPTSI